MSKSKRKSGKVLATVNEQTTVRAGSSRDDTQGGTAAGLVDGAYDALDYRLMATFPASDAVAQY